jgi:prepilin-type N-terminal cleavage/methylation domain-containing protein
MTHRSRAMRGFTLVEILISIVLVGILSAVAVVAVGRLTGEGNAAACSASADAARAAVDVHRTATGSEPRSFTDLTTSRSLELPTGTRLDPTAKVLIADQWQLVMLPGPPARFTCDTDSPALRDGAVALWRFDQSNQITAVDSGPNQLHGSWTSNAGRTAEGVTPGTNGALIDDSRGMFVPTVASGSVTDIRGAVSVEAWINPSVTGLYGGVVDKTVGGNHNQQYSLFVWAGIIYWRLSTPGGIVDATFSPVGVNRWSHVVGTWDGTTAVLYVDGVVRRTVTGVGPLRGGAGQVMIGSLGSGGFPMYPFRGFIDEVAIYDRALSAAAVTARWSARNDLVAYRNAVTADTPVANWRFEETAATAVDDSGPNNVDAQWSLAEARPAPGFGAGSNAADFGSRDFVDVGVGTNSPVDLTRALSIEAWVNPTSNRQFGGIVDKLRNGFANQQYALYYWNGTLALRLVIDGVLIDTAWGGLQINRWTHVAATWDGTTARLYADGVQVATRAVSGVLTGGSGPLRIGTHSIHPFQGRLDEVAIYDRALTPAEVLSHATSVARS